MAFQISLTSTSSELNFEYFDGIRLIGRYDVSLKSMVTYNNIPNITETNNEIVFISNTDASKKFPIILPTGTYEVQDLIDFSYLLMKMFLASICQRIIEVFQKLFVGM